MENLEPAKRGPGRPSKKLVMNEFASGLAKDRTAKYGDPSEDWSYVPPEAIPEGCVVQWIVHEILGKPVEAYEIQKFTMNGWQVYPLDLYPQLALAGQDTNENIVKRNGQVLYIRRKELEDEAREEELRKARTQLRSNIEETSGRPMDTGAPRTKAKIKATYEAIPVEE